MDWLGLVFLLGALVLVGPGAWQIIKGNPGFALNSVMWWLGIAVLLGVLYVYGGVGEWWEARHGGGVRVQSPSDPFGDTMGDDQLAPLPRDN